VITQIGDKQKYCGPNIVINNYYDDDYDYGDDQPRVKQMWHQKINALKKQKEKQ
jgi:hypothetical protein